MEFFHIPYYFFLKLLKITFSHKSVGAPNFKAPTLTTPLQCTVFLSKKIKQTTLEFSVHCSMNSWNFKMWYPFIRNVMSDSNLYSLFPEISQNCFVITIISFDRMLVTHMFSEEKCLIKQGEVWFCVIYRMLDQELLKSIFVVLG